jgi:hypothetical protein
MFQTRHILQTASQLSVSGVEPENTASGYDQARQER